MRNFNTTRIGLGSDAQVDSVWFDKHDGIDWRGSSITLEILNKFKNSNDDTVWVKTQFEMTPAQAREIVIALIIGLQGQTALLDGENELIERGDIAFDIYDINLSSKTTV